MLASYSCVQDTTADLNQTVGSNQGEMVTLSATISAPEARTELGAKSGNAYPVYWSEGDIVSVNGYAAGVEILRSDKSVANLSVPASLETPYNLVYPWVEGVEASAKAGYSPVVFASVQAHTEGSFAQGSAPMYGYANGFESILLHHLVVALRFEIKAKDGESVNLKYLTVSTSNGAPISGVFDVNCSNGALEARSSASSTIIYDLGENGLTLSSATSNVFYVAVPQGTYEGFEVNYIAENGAVMTKTFSGSGSSKLVAGKVREFPVVEFEPSSSMYLISNEAEMLEFANNVVNGSVTTEGAMLVADITMSEGAWTPIDIVDLVFDGNNKVIKGLTTPLFNSVASTVRNVNVESYFTASNETCVGAICNKLEGGSLVNCATSGRLVFDNSSNVGSGPDEIVVGGMVGLVSSGEMVNCRNKMEVVVESAAALNLESTSYMSLGGLIGSVNGDMCNIHDCENHAEVIINETLGKATSSICIGGVAGSVLAADAFNKCYNYGTLTQATPVNALYMGGVAGFALAPINWCQNKGTLNVKSDALVYYIGGIASQAMSMQGNTNYGAINASNSPLTAEAESGTASVHIGGVAAYASSAIEEDFAMTSDENAIFDGNKNYGPIYSVLSMYGSDAMCVAGVVGRINLAIANCTNYAEGTVYVGGVIPPVQIGGMAGVVGRSTADTNTIINVHNHADISAHYTLSVMGAPIYHAGCIAHALGAVSNSSNNGRILVATDCTKITATDVVTLGGCLDYAEHGVLTNLSNTGEVRYEGKTMNTVKMGGIARYVNGSASTTMTDCVNNGNIVFAGVIGNTLYVGGCVQDCDMSMLRCGSTGNITIDQKGAVNNTLQLGGLMNAISGSDNAVYEDCVVSGEYKIACVFGGSIYIGGFFYNLAKGCTVRNCENKANIHITPTCITAGSGDFIAGFLSSLKLANVKFYNCVNSGNILYEGMANAKKVYLCGISANHSADATGAVIKDCVNTGDMVFKSVPGVASTYVYISGILTNSSMPLAESSGNINRGVMHADALLKNNFYVGGCVGTYSGTTGSLTGFTNEGSVSIAGKADGNAYVGGTVAYANLSLASTEAVDGSGDSVNNCHNSGDVWSDARIVGNVYIGGVTAFSSMKCSPLFDCTNSGNVRLGGIVNGGDSTIGGVGGKIGAAVVNCKNSGKVEVDASLQYQAAVGGVVGGVLRSAEVTVECANNENTGDVLAKGLSAVGAITGTTRNVVLMPNSKVGGKVWRGSSLVDITESNFMDYIYGEKWSGGETEPAYDGATFVQVTPTEPEEGTEGNEGTEGTI